jgi:primosomal protein N' (replication factor Y)
LAEFRVLDYLGERDLAREQTLRDATRISKSVLAGMVRKKWITREDLSDARPERTVKVALLKTAEGKLNANQQVLVNMLAAAGGKAAVETLQGLEVPRTTLATLVKRGLVEIVMEPAEFVVSGVKASSLALDFQFNCAQEKALARVRSDVAAGKFSGMLLHGVTGSGKTAV